MKNIFYFIIILFLSFNTFVFSSVDTKLVFVSNTYDTPGSGKGTLIISVQAESNDGSTPQIRTFQDAFQTDATLNTQIQSVNFSNEYFSSGVYNTSENYSSSDGSIDYIYTYNLGSIQSMPTTWTEILKVTIVYNMVASNTNLSWYSGTPNFYVTDGSNTEIEGSELSIPSNLQNIALPVELTSFTASTNNNTVNLNWKTASEVNNYGFEVQRSAVSDQQSADISWQKIGFVKGAGNSNSPQSYSYTDNDITGGTKFKYRLKQIDNDGKYEYSSEVEVTMAPAQYTLYQNYPNPFNPTTTIRFNLPQAARVTLIIYNIVGQEVAKLINNQDLSAGFHSATFDGKRLASGTYIYRLQADNFTQIKKMILLK